MRSLWFVLSAALLLIGLGFWFGSGVERPFFEGVMHAEQPAEGESSRLDHRETSVAPLPAELAVKTPSHPIVSSNSPARGVSPKELVPAARSLSRAPDSSERSATTDPDSLSEREDGEQSEEVSGWMQTRYLETQQERANIKDNATREHRRLNFEELAESWGLEFALQEEVGDAAYEQLLYQEGRRNRVKVHWVTRGSNALAAGLQKGDVILSYGGSSIFSPQALRERNKLLETGQSVSIEYSRDGTVYESVIDVDHLAPTRGGLVNGMSLIPYSEEPE